MRKFLTTAAVTLVILLTLALIAPPFVDWSSLRAPLQAQLGAIANANISLDGPVDLRLLPAPRVTATRMRLERAGLKFSAREAAFEIAPWDLLRGRIRFVEAGLASARFEIDPAELSLTQNSDVGLERFSIRDGVFFLKAEQPLEISGVDLEGKADSLRGPVSASGFIRGLKGSRPFTLAIGEAQSGRAGLKFEIAPYEDLPMLKFEGAATQSPEGLRLEGMGVWERRLGDGEQAPILRMDGLLSGDRGRAKIERLNLAIGAGAGREGPRLMASGRAEFESSQGWRALLFTQNVDLDALSQRWRLSELAAPMFSGQPGVKIAALQMQAKATRWNGQVLRLFDLDFNADSKALNLQTDLPGGFFKFAGLWPGLAGPADAAPEREDKPFFFLADVQDRAQFAQWFEPMAPSFARSLSNAPFKAIRAEGSAARVAGGDVYTFQNLALTLDRFHFKASGRWLAPGTDTRARLEGRVEIPLVDLGDMPDLSQILAREAIDFDLEVAAGALKYGLQQDLGAFSLKARRDASGLALENIAFTGPQAQVQGRLVQNDAGWNGELTVNAARVGELARLTEAFRPSSLGATIAARAQDFSPAKLSLKLKADATGQSATMEGEAGGARFSLFPSGAGALSLVAQSSDASVLLRQIGFSALPGPRTSPARLDLRWPIAGQGPFSASFSLAGLDGSFSGIGGWDKNFSARGTFKALTKDAQPTLQLLGLSAGGAAPAAIDAQMSLSSERVELEEISALVMGRKATGRLSRALGGNSDGVWRGALTLDEFFAPGVLATILGEAQPARANELWSEIGFAPVAYDLPPLDVELSAPRLAGEPLGFIGPLSDFRAHLQTLPGRLRLREIFAHAGDGKVNAEAEFLRDKGLVSLRGGVSLENVNVSTGPLFARLSAKMDFAGTGGSASALIGSLAGSGVARLEQIRIDKASSQALGATITDFEQRREPYAASDVARDFRDRLNAGPQNFDSLEGALRMAGGRLNFSDDKGDASNLSIAFDAPSGQSDIAVRQRVPAPAGWQGAPPSALIIFQGRAKAFRRSVDVDDLAAQLLGRTLERELARSAQSQEPTPQAHAPVPPLAPIAPIAPKIVEKPTLRPEATHLLPRPAPHPTHRPASRPATRTPNAFAPVPYDHAPDPASVGRY